MKNKSPSRQQKSGRQKAKTEMSGQSTAVAGGYIVRPANTKYGPRSTHWREQEYAQAAIGALFSGGPPPIHLNHSWLTARVNDWLAQVPRWRASGYGKEGKVSRMTVIRALEMYRDANR